MEIRHDAFQREVKTEFSAVRGEMGGIQEAIRLSSERQCQLLERLVGGGHAALPAPRIPPTSTPPRLAITTAPHGTTGSHGGGSFSAAMPRSSSFPTAPRVPPPLFPSGGSAIALPVVPVPLAPTDLTLVDFLNSRGLPTDVDGGAMHRFLSVVLGTTIGSTMQRFVDAALHGIRESGGDAAFGGICEDHVCAVLFTLVGGFKALTNTRMCPGFSDASYNLLSDQRLLDALWYAFWYTCENLCQTVPNWSIENSRINITHAELRDDTSRRAAFYQLIQVSYSC